MADEVPKGVYRGVPADRAIQDEREHFMTCPVCGKTFDMRDLGEVFDHYHDGPPLRFVRRQKH